VELTFAMYLYKNYDISSNGFLPNKCINVFPEQLIQYQTLLDSMHQVANYRQYIDNIKISVPIIDLFTFSIEEKKFIYSALSIIINKYIWCNGENNVPQSIPSFLGKLWYDCAESIGIVPVLTNAAVDLYNWSLINEKEDPLEYEPTEEEKSNKQCVINFKNIMINYTMTNTKDEHWFYLIMIAIEFHGGKIVNIVETINEAMKNNNNILIHDQLLLLNEQIIKIKKVLKRIYEYCKPEIFYNQIRIYLNGFDEKYFSDGLQIDGIDFPNKIYYKGGSAAQSTLIQILDVLLHENEIGCEFSKNFLKEMLNYMPSKHKKYVLNLKTNKEEYNLHNYIKQTCNNNLINNYNFALTQLQLFRKTHFQIVKDYIFNFSNKNALGTGGTQAKIFLTDLVKKTKTSSIMFSRWLFSGVINSDDHIVYKIVALFKMWILLLLNISNNYKIYAAVIIFFALFKLFIL
jgi:indoleamine 2,3-dioxygenase